MAKVVGIDPSPRSEKSREIQEEILRKSVDELYAHGTVPICIGHPNIPELRWCHAQYASIPTKTRLNFLTFKS